MDRRNVEYLIVPLDKHATSFCHYENPAYYQHGSELITIKALERVIDYADRNRISVNFIYGNHELPAPYAQLVESVEHVKIAPLKLLRKTHDGIFVINKDDRNGIKQIEKNSHLNLILRLERERLVDLAEIFYCLLGKFERLNLCLLNLEQYRDKDLKEYENQLKKIEMCVVEEYKAEKTIEMNFISDRLMLQNMNNCDAGIKHLTVAHNGKFYLCPGFYYDKNNDSVGALTSEIKNENSQLLELDHAPICRNCDAYHCKRCVYLNKMVTLEINTPSHQQCVTSHLERNISRRILDTLKPTVELFQEFVSIPEIPYLDPFEILNDTLNRSMDKGERERLISELLSKPLEKFSVRELLHQVNRLDRGLLIRLKNMNLNA
jgi:CXXX repeat peptide maturase